MYFDKAERQDHHVSITHSEWAVLSINGLSILLLGIFPSGLFNICANVLK